jgi:hypothetical protein
VTVVLRDQDSLRLARQIVELNGGPLSARGPQLDLLARLWTAVNGWLAATARTLTPESDVGEESSSRGLRSRFRRRRAS